MGGRRYMWIGYAHMEPPYVHGRCPHVAVRSKARESLLSAPASLCLCLLIVCILACVGRVWRDSAATTSGVAAADPGRGRPRELGPDSSPQSGEGGLILELITIRSPSRRVECGGTIPATSIE